MHNNLKFHYRNEDLPLVETALGQFLVASEKAERMIENAEFEHKQEVVSEILGSLENIMMLNRKKIEEDVTAQATAYIRNYYYG
ncbi:hypothetical protein MKY30_24025 [Oceanobacillus sp. FSL W8-0428]|uniref:hypothetical protein n=1 Tax=Oceanobacillus sp. FSL W8-0428 TaxID=2921715 RepID=UPI0030FB551A